MQLNDQQAAVWVNVSVELAAIFRDAAAAYGDQIFAYSKPEHGIYGVSLRVSDPVDLPREARYQHPLSIVYTWPDDEMSRLLTDDEAERDRLFGCLRRSIQDMVLAADEVPELSFSQGWQSVPGPVLVRLDDFGQ